MRWLSRLLVSRVGGVKAKCEREYSSREQDNNNLANRFGSLSKYTDWLTSRLEPRKTTAKAPWPMMSDRLYWKSPTNSMIYRFPAAWGRCEVERRRISADSDARCAARASAARNPSHRRHKFSIHQQTNTKQRSTPISCSTHGVPAPPHVQVPASCLRVLHHTKIVPEINGR